MKKEYNVESYWSDVAQRIAQREDSNVVAGDDEPFYRYKRQEFLKLLNQIDFKDKVVLEVGCGPGGNLTEIFKHNPQELVGVDISDEMVNLAKKNCPNNITILKIDGSKLPFDDNYFDIVFTATVLQHNTNLTILNSLIEEICRVSHNRVYLFERIEPKIEGDDLNQGRPVSFYAEKMKNLSFNLAKTEYINIRVSYFLAGIARKALNKSTRKEGEPLNKVSILIQNLSLPITRKLDKIFKSKRDLAKIEFLKD
jgi:SAM-dependent methyltransferase